MLTISLPLSLHHAPHPFRVLAQDQNGFYFLGQVQHVEQRKDVLPSFEKHQRAVVHLDTWQGTE